MAIETKSAFKKATISLAASGVGCTRWLGRGSLAALVYAIVTVALCQKLVKGRLMSHSTAFADQVASCTAHTQSLLRAAGWTPNRHVDNVVVVQTLQAAGHPIFPQFQRFRESFGGLTLEWTITDAASGRLVTTDIRLDPLAALARLGNDGLNDEKEALGKSLCPLGVFDRASEILVMAGDEHVYSVFQLLLYRCGKTGVQAIDSLVADKPILVLRNAEGINVHEWH
jgi:hypothetical protein